MGRFAVGYGHGAVNLRVGGQRGLDLAEFDPETADLDLLVRAGEELERAVRRPADQVAGAVHPAAVGGEGVGHETGGGLGGAPVVAARHSWTGQVQLARDAGRHQRQVLVQDEGVRIGDAAADGRCAAADLRGHRVHGELGGAVEVVGRDLRRRGQLCPQPGGHCLAAEGQQQGLFPWRLEQAALQQLAGVGRRRFQHVDAVAAAVAGERLGVAADVVGHDMELRAGDQPQHRVPGGVEAEAGDVRHGDGAVRTGGLEARRVQGAVVVAVQVGEGAVRDGHPLGAAGGTGGVEHVGQVTGGRAALCQGGVGNAGTCCQQRVDVQRPRTLGAVVACMPVRRRSRRRERRPRG